jgi:hypothetical protein
MELWNCGIDIVCTLIVNTVNMVQVMGILGPIHVPTDNNQHQIMFDQ